ncbi:MAG: YbhN family protein [Opitutales bacterium]
MNGPDTPLDERIEPRRWLLHALRGLAVTSFVAIVVVTVLADDIDWGRVVSFPPAVALLILAMVFVAWTCNGLRTWTIARAFGHRLGVRQALGITLSMEFVIASTPGGVGGWVTRTYLQRRAGIPIATTGAMLGADAIADLLFFLMLAPMALGAVLNMDPVRELLGGVDWAIVGMVAAGVGGLLALKTWLLSTGRAGWLKRLLPAKVKRQEGWVRRQVGRVRAELRQAAESAGFLFKERRGAFLGSFGLATIQWCCRYGVLPVILWGLGSPLDPLALMLIQGSLFLVGLLVVAPGGGGALEVLSVLILGPLVGGGQAALAVVLWRLATYYLYLLGGGVTFFCVLANLKADPGPEAAPQNVGRSSKASEKLSFENS